MLDWGDDPSFFAASTLLGDVRRATWGVCRRDVRACLSPGDFVVFVCARADNPPVWDYHFVGVATLGYRLTRDDVWSVHRYARYRDFLNIIARPRAGGGLKQHEWVHPFHADWLARCSAPYWLFDPDDTVLNLDSPILLATYRGQARSIETWHTHDGRVGELRSLLLRGAPETRGLRSVNAQQPHAKLNLKRGYTTDSALSDLRKVLLERASH